MKSRSTLESLRSAAVAVRLAVVVGAASVSAGCVSGEFTYLTDQRYPAREKTYSIEVLNHPPTKPNLRLGNASSHASPFDGEQACLDELKNQARSAGGDAIGDYEYHVAPPGTVNEGASICRATIYRWL